MPMQMRHKAANMGFGPGPSRVVPADPANAINAGLDYGNLDYNHMYYGEHQPGIGNGSGNFNINQNFNNNQNLNEDLFSGGFPFGGLGGFDKEKRGFGSDNDNTNINRT
ncbi:hypothetical protein RUND412_009192 [Rhizina undulata]